MEKDELRSLLNQPYKPANWKKITEYVFPNVSYLHKPQDIPHTNGIIKSFKQIGNVKLNDGKNLAMFEVNVAENVQIARNRVALRNLVTPFIDQEHNHGVLVIYEQGKEDYRFTFTAKSTEFDEEEGDFVNIETDSKRYTYVLGRNETCKTAANRFWELSKNKEKATIKDVQDAFSVEKLSKQFFTEYKAQYQSMVAYLTSGTKAYYASVFNGDEKKIRDFVKLFLGRIIFIKFIQKKGWLGVPANSATWDNGQQDFIESAFRSFELPNIFLSSFLNPLFFGALNCPDRSNDIFELTGTKVPYLNGGLFENEDPKLQTIDFPSSYFDSLFDFLDQYNFTIDESDPVEREVSIDPEMLGHIFENLLEDNKDKGAFYTPKPIVHYMCQESLIEYLNTILHEKNVLPENEEQKKHLEEAIRKFVVKKQCSELVNDYDEQLAIALRDVKICDPAIGSGAFPMGLLNEIFHCVQVLHDASPDTVGAVWEMENWQPNIVKQNIIQNSIYGVDIEKGAVDIARLRFWLSLIVDEPVPTALPNLDYKIVVGNSLLSTFENDIIDIDWTIDDAAYGLFGADLAEQKNELLKTISKKQKDFFKPRSNKHRLSEEIRNLKIDLIANQIKLMIEKQDVSSEPKLTDYRNKPKSKFTEDYNRYLQTIGWKEKIKKLKKLKEDTITPLHFFDWKLDFPEIMNDRVNQKVGFDIVVGNPPYVDSENMIKNQPILREHISQLYYTAKGNWDLYIPFHELALKILKSKGVKSFISPNKWLSIAYSLELRKAYTKFLYKICNCNDVKVFEAGVTPVISFFKKYPSNSFIVDKVDGLYKFETVNELSSSVIDENSLGILLSKSSKILIKIKSLKNTFKNWLTCENPFSTGEAYKLCEILHDSQKFKTKSFKLINTGTIDPYISLWGIKDTSYLKEKYLYPHAKHSDLRSYFPKRLTQIESPKLIITGMRYLECYFDEGGDYIAGKSTLIIRDIQKNYFNFFCALLNSKLISFYIKQSYSTLGIDGGVNFTKEIIEGVPIPELEKNFVQSISKICAKIISQKSQDKDTTKLEHQIDNLVYRLYGLNYDEVKVIDPVFSLSKTEYNSIAI